MVNFIQKRCTFSRNRGGSALKLVQKVTYWELGYVNLKRKGIKINNPSSISTNDLKTRIKKFGQSSVQFDGAEDYVTITDPSSSNPKFDYETSDFTIEGQFRLNLLNNNKCLVSQVKDADNFYALRYNSSVGLQFDAYSGGTQVMNVAHGTTTGYAANSNTFMHVAVSRSGTRMRLFRDGSELSGVTTSNSMPTIGTSYNVELGRLNLTATEERDMLNKFNGV